MPHILGQPCDTPHWCRAWRQLGKVLLSSLVDDLLLLHDLLHDVLQGKNLTRTLAAEGGVPGHGATEVACNAECADLGDYLGCLFLHEGLLELSQIVHGT